MAIRKKKIIKKHCALMDKSCLRGECSLYYTRFDRCSIELMPDNLYFSKEAMAESTDVSTMLAEQIDALTKKLYSDSQTKLF